MALCSSWTWGQKNHGEFFLTEFPMKKNWEFFIMKGIEETFRRVKNIIKN
jgi:hypothetical protein